MEIAKQQIKIEHDLHIHTYLSSCCSEKQLQIPKHIIPLAENMGLKTIGFADHLWTNPGIPASDWYKPQDGSQITKLKQDLAPLKTKLRVLVGCEADTAAPGKFSITAAYAKTLDYVLLSCSHIHLDDFEKPVSYAPRAIAEHLLKMFLSGVKSGIPDIIAHPFALFGQLGGLYQSVFSSISSAELFDVFSTAAKNNVAIELNWAAIGRLPPEEAERFVTTARKAGCKFTFGSDAHGPAGQQALMKMEPFINKVGLTEKDILPLAK